MASIVKVLVTHIIDPLNFWARIGTDDELYSIANFVDIVNNYGAMTTASEPPDNSASVSVTVGQHVIAKSQLGGGQWRNAIVISAGFSESDDVDVMYLDFGMTEFVPRNHLLVKPPELVLKSYASVHHCQLDGILPLPQGWSRQALAVFSSLVLNQPLRAAVVSQSHSISVELFARSESGLRRTVADILVHNGLAMSAKAAEIETTGKPAELQLAAVCPPLPSESSVTAAAATIQQFDLTTITQSLQELPSPTAAPADVTGLRTGKGGQESSRDFERDEFVRDLDTEFGFEAVAYTDLHSCESDYVAAQYVDIYSRLSEDIKQGNEAVCGRNLAAAGSFDAGDAQKPENRNRRPNRFNNVPRNDGRGPEQSRETRDKPRLELAKDSVQTNENRSDICSPMHGLRLNVVPAAENRAKTAPAGTLCVPAAKAERAASDDVAPRRTQSDFSVSTSDAKDAKTLRSAETRSKNSRMEKQCQQKDAGSFRPEQSGDNIPKNESGAGSMKSGRKETGSAKQERTVAPRFTAKMSSHHPETKDSTVEATRSGSAGRKAGNGKSRRSPPDAAATAESSNNNIQRPSIRDKKPAIGDVGKTATSDARDNRKSETSPTEISEARSSREPPPANTSSVERVVKKTWRKFDDIMRRYASGGSANKIAEKLREQLVMARSVINEADVKLDERPLSLCVDVVIDSRLCNVELAGLAIMILSELRSEPDFVDVVSHLLLDYSHRFVRSGNSERREKLRVAFCDFVAELYVAAVSWPDCKPVCSVIQGIVDKWSVFDRKGQNSGGSSALELYTQCLLQFVCGVSTHSVELFRRHFPSIVDAATEKLLSNSLPVSVKEKLLKLLLKVEREKIRQQYGAENLTRSVPVPTATNSAAAAVCSQEVQTISSTLNDVECQTDISMCADASADNHRGDEVNCVEDTNHAQSTWYPEQRDDAAAASAANDFDFPSLAVASSFHEKKHETLFVRCVRRNSGEKSSAKNQPMPAENFSPPVVSSLAKISAELVAAASGDSRSPPATLIDGGQFVWTALPRKRSIGNDGGAYDSGSGSRQKEKPHHGPVLVHSAGGVAGKPTATSAAASIVLADFFDPCQLPATDSSQESDPASEFVPRLVCTLCGERTHSILQCSRSFGDFFCDS